MTLNSKLAFEIWAGIVVLVIVIGGIAGVTLMIGDDTTAPLVRTQVAAPSPSASPTPFVSSEDIAGASAGISQALLGGVSAP